MNLILFSDSIKSLNLEAANSSSEKFEINLCLSLSVFFENINIISSVYKENNCSKDNIKLFNNNELKNFQISKGDIVLSFGYNPIKLAKLILLKIFFKVKIYTYIFDSHKTILRYRKLFRSIFINLFYSIGFLLIKYFNGIILLNPNAKNYIKFNIPSLVSKIGMIPNNYDIYSGIKKFIVIFSGTLNNENGIKEAIQSVIETHKKIDIVLEIFGDGPLIDYVINITRNYSFIHYYGRVTQKKLISKYKEANVLLNLRDPNDKLNDFSFPSKLIEFLSFKKPVISTNFTNLIDLDKYCYVVSNLNPHEISNSFINIYNESPDILNYKILNSYDYIESNYNWNDIGQSIFNFFEIH